MATSASVLTKEQLEILRRKLEDERRRIARVLATPATSAPSEDERTELEEVAQRSAEGEDQQKVVERERALLAEVARALAKLDAGTYGLSEKSGAPIPFERLRSVPWARVDVDED
ncbi:TraR/DksA family transcriptional regulator [Anaeromyxobacter terrae]|uniref:TraR/DksA family transcriptional regulator n=1 Tax=Anaeromyxobacter terrae TaxID=2925406 RepID=UPI001F592F09|nr:TraR/DksA family transcriptional regulator [Anaeromyxobacter sp. SG22]